jgi:hypothetical protein
VNLPPLPPFRPTHHPSSSSAALPHPRLAPPHPTCDAEPSRAAAHLLPPSPPPPAVVSAADPGCAAADLGRPRLLLRLLSAPPIQAAPPTIQAAPSPSTSVRASVVPQSFRSDPISSASPSLPPSLHCGADPISRASAIPRLSRPIRGRPSFLLYPSPTPQPRILLRPSSAPPLQLSRPPRFPSSLLSVARIRRQQAPISSFTHTHRVLRLCLPLRTPPLQE